MFKEMIAEEDLAKSEEREREETVSDEEMAKRYSNSSNMSLAHNRLEFYQQTGCLVKNNS